MSGVDVLAVMDADGRAVTFVIDDCSPGTLRQRQWEAHLQKHDEARAAVAELIEAATALLETQDAVDNRETAGPNAEDYFVLIRRRNAAQHDFADALANVTGGAA